MNVYNSALKHPTLPYFSATLGYGWKGGYPGRNVSTPTLGQIGDSDADISADANV